MRLTVKLVTLPSNFVQSMKLNINVVGKKRKDEQDRRTCIWPDVEVFDSSPTIHRFALDYPIGIVVGHSIRLHQLREVLCLSTSTIHHPLTLDFFHFEKIRHEDSDTECSMFRPYDISSLYRVFAFVPGIFLESGRV